MTKTEFDSEMRAALGERQVPQHREGFFASVEAQLADIEVEPAPSRRARRMIVWTTPVAIAAAVAALLLAVPNAHTTKPPSVAAPNPTTSSMTASTELRPLLAADVIAKVNAEVASIRSISGTTTDHVFPVNTLRESVTTTEFRQDSAGKLWTRAHGPEGTITTSVYDPATGTTRACCRNAAPQADVSVNMPDTDPARLSPFSTPIGEVRALSEGNSATLKNVDYSGQPAWQLHVKDASDGGDLDSYDITVLQDTAFPVHVVGYAKGRVQEEVTVSNLKINPDLSSADFQVSFPNGVQVNNYDAGYVHTDPQGVPNLAGYKAFVPAYVPDGYTLSTVSVFKGDGHSGVNGKNGQIIFDKDVVTLTYRRGLQMLIITTQSTNGTPPSQWGDPLAPVDGPYGDVHNIKFAGGAFDGVNGQTVGISFGGPHIWAAGAHWVLSISGDPSVEDMVKVAQSLNQ